MGLAPDFRENAFNFLPLRIIFTVGVSYIAFIMLRYVPSMPVFLWRFIVSGLTFRPLIHFEFIFVYGVRK